MIAALRDLLALATPGPWRICKCGCDHIVSGERPNDLFIVPVSDCNGTDADAIVAAVNNLPSLLDIAEAVRAYRDAVDEREAVASADGVAGGEEPGQMARLAIAETNAYRAMIGALKALETAK